VDLKDTVSGFKGIMDGKYDDLPEMAFYMVRTRHAQMLRRKGVSRFLWQKPLTLTLTASRTARGL
jgi:hypothetical protein